MAKLSAHGREIGRIQYTTQMRAYMSDSAVLVNSGSGWKLKGKLRAGLTPESAFKPSGTAYSLDETIQFDADEEE